MASPPASPELTATVTDGALRLRGDFIIWTLDKLPAEAASARTIDLSGVGRLDTAAAAYLTGREQDGVTLQGLSTAQAGLSAAACSQF